MVQTGGDRYSYLDLTDYTKKNPRRHVIYSSPNPNYKPKPGEGGDSNYNVTTSTKRPGKGTTRPKYRDMPTYEDPDIPTMPKFETPEFVGPKGYDVPDFNAPEYDEEEVKARTRKKAAPGLRNLRQQMNVAQTQQYENPNVKAMTMRDAMTGYGQGLESVMAGAEASARAEYGSEYALDYETAKSNYVTGVQQSRDEYEVLSRGLLASYQADVQGARMDYESERETGRMGYEAERDKRRREYEDEGQRRQREYADAWQDYVGSFEAETTTRPMTEKEIRDANRN